MMKNVFILILISFLNIGYIYSNEAKFAVNNIQVEKVSATAKEAKDIAIINGQRQGLAIVFERLGLNKDNLKFISNDIISQMVDSIQISDEIISSTKYSGTLFINFNKEFIEYYTKQLKIENGNILPTKYLYIPVLQVNDSYMLLSEKNIWRNSTIDVILENKYDYITLLNNNPVNETLIKKDKIQNPMYNDFVSILKTHNTNTVLFSIVKYNTENDILEIVLKELNAEENKEIRLNLFNKEKLATNDLFLDAANKVLIYIKKMLKESTINTDTTNNNSNEIDTDKKTKSFNASLLFTNLDELNFFKEILKNLSFIQNYKIKTITTKEIIAEINLNVPIEEAYNLFKEQNILIKLKDNKYYLIYLDM